METVDLKLVLLGQPNVGKTCLVYRYLYNSYGETISTIGASFAMKKVHGPRTQIPTNLGIWDTAGQERFDSLSSFYCRGARAAIVCYDLTDISSFDALKDKWIRKVLDEAEPGCHVCIVGTKRDLIDENLASRAVQKADVDALAQKHNADSFEASARSGVGVEDIFRTIVEHFQMRSAGASGGAASVRVGQARVRQPGCCS